MQYNKMSSALALMLVLPCASVQAMDYARGAVNGVCDGARWTACTVRAVAENPVVNTIGVGAGVAVASLWAYDAGRRGASCAKAKYHDWKAARHAKRHAAKVDDKVADDEHRHDVDLGKSSAAAAASSALSPRAVSRRDREDEQLSLLSGIRADLAALNARVSKLERPATSAAASSSDAH